MEAKELINKSTIQDSDCLRSELQTKLEGISQSMSPDALHSPDLSSTRQPKLQTLKPKHEHQNRDQFLIVNSDNSDPCDINSTKEAMSSKVKPKLDNTSIEQLSQSQSSQYYF